MAKNSNADARYAIDVYTMSTNMIALHVAIKTQNVYTEKEKSSAVSVKEVVRLYAFTTDINIHASLALDVFTEEESNAVRNATVLPLVLTKQENGIVKYARGLRCVHITESDLNALYAKAHQSVSTKNENTTVLYAKEQASVYMAD